MEIPEKVAFHYIKSSDYRPIYVDGVIGGLTPRGLIQMSVFSEHTAIPQKTVSKFLPDGTLGDNLSDEEVSRGGIVRDLSATLLFNEDLARRLVDWLNVRLDELVQAKKIAQGLQKDGGNTP
jgi:hypothetical protein